MDSIKWQFNWWIYCWVEIGYEWKKGYFSSGRVKVFKNALTVNRTRGLQITGDVVFSLTLSQLSYQSYHLFVLENAEIEPATSYMLITRSTNWANPPIWCVLIHHPYFKIIYLFNWPHILYNSEPILIPPYERLLNIQYSSRNQPDTLSYYLSKYIHTGFSFTGNYTSFLSWNYSYSQLPALQTRHKQLNTHSCYKNYWGLISYVTHSV